jgi:hypothetical protein
LYGLKYHDFYLFRLDTKDLSLSPSSIEDLSDKVLSFDGKNSPLAINLENITATRLHLAKTYYVNLFSYCIPESDNQTYSCYGKKPNWASDIFNITSSNNLQVPAGLNITLPDKLAHIVRHFGYLSYSTQVLSILAILGLGVELFISLSSTCSRLVSCVVWLLAAGAIILVGVAASLTTAQAAIVVSAVKATKGWHGADGQINGKYLASLWASFLLAIASALFWLPTICC